MWEIGPASLVRVPKEVLVEFYDDAAVLLDSGTGAYVGIDGTGVIFWRALAGGTIESAVSTLARVFDAEPSILRQDLVVFCQRLANLGLLEITNPDSLPQPGL